MAPASRHHRRRDRRRHRRRPGRRLAHGMLDAREAALGFERAKLGDAAYARRLAALRSGGAEQDVTRRPGAGHAAGQHRDRRHHPVHGGQRLAARRPHDQVEVRDSDGTRNGALLASLTTDNRGRYNATFTTKRTNGQPRKPFVKAFAAGRRLPGQGLGASAPHVIQSTPVTPTGAAITANLTANKTDDNNTAFDVADMLTTALPTRSASTAADARHDHRVVPERERDELQRLDRRGRRSSSSTATTGTSCCTSTGTSSRARWPSTPARADRTARRRTSARPLGKDAGVKLAWSEGFATYFAISSQNVLAVKAMNIPKAGDTFYDDTEDATLHIAQATNAGRRAWARTTSSRSPARCGTSTTTAPSRSPTR